MSGSRIQRRAGSMLAYLAVLHLSLTLNAATIQSVWVGGTEPAEWNLASNWSPALIPDNNGNVFNVVIQPGLARIVNPNATINTMRVQPGAELFLIAEPAAPSLLTINGNLTGGIGIVGGARVNVGGDFMLDGYSLIGNNLDVRGRIVANNAYLNLESPTAALTVGGGTLGGFTRIAGAGSSTGEMRGTLVIRNGDLTVSGRLDASGRGDIVGDGPLSRLIIAPGAEMQVAGGNTGRGLHLLNRGLLRTSIATDSWHVSLSGARSVTNDGVIDSRGPGMDIDAATLTNYNAATGTLTGGQYLVRRGSTLSLKLPSGEEAPIVTNAATILVEDFADFSSLNALSRNEGTLTVLRPLATSGSLTNSGLLQVTDLTLGGPAVFTQTIGITSGNINASTININGGTLEAGSRLQGDVNNNSLIRQNSVERPTTIQGDYRQSELGRMDVAVGPLEFYDRFGFDITGTAFLDGTLDIHFSFYEPKVGDAFTVLTYAARMGEFDQIRGFGRGIGLTPTYGPDSLILTVTASDIPEPSTMILVSGCLALIAFGKRRRSLLGKRPSC